MNLRFDGCGMMACVWTLWAGIASAATVNYVMTDTTGWIVNTNKAQEASGCTSLDSSGKNTVSVWKDGAFPVSGQKYLIRTARIRAPTKTSAEDKMWWFAGDTLAIDGSDLALIAEESSIKFNFADLRLYTGSLTTWTASSIYLGGSLCIDSRGSAQSFALQGRQQLFNVYSTVTSATDQAYLAIRSENNGWHKEAGDSYGRFTARFLGDTSAFYGTVAVISSNATFQAAGPMPVSVLTMKATDEVSSCGPLGSGAAYNSVDLVEGASLIVPGTNTLSVGDLTVADGAALVWNTAADGSLGTLVVTNSLSIIKPFTIHIADATPHAAGGTADLLKVPASFDLETTDFVIESDGAFGSFPMVYDPEIVTDDETKMVRVHVRSSVTLNSSDPSAYWTAALSSSLTNAANWSDAQLPHAGAVYVIPDGMNLRTPEPAEAKTFPTTTFLGDLLVVESNALLAVRSDFSVNLLMKHHSNLYTTGEGGTSVELGGTLAVPTNAAEYVEIEAYMTRQHRIASEITGGCLVKIAGRDSSGSPGGTIALEGLNTNFMGRIQVTIGTKQNSDGSAKCPLPTTKGHERLRISDARNLGGKLSAFGYNALRLDQWSELLTTNNVTIPADSNRGLFLYGVATLTPSKNTTLAINTPITYRGRVRKDGAGTLALGAKPNFIDGTGTKEPLATTNVLEVIAGAIRADTTNALDGVAVVFSNNTQWVVSAAATDDLKAYGAVNARSELGGFASEATDGMIDVAFSDVVAEDAPAFEVALCTLADKTAAETLVPKLRVARPCKNCGVSAVVRENADGRATILLNVVQQGMMLIIR